MSSEGTRRAELANKALYWARTRAKQQAGQNSSRKTTGPAGPDLIERIKGFCKELTWAQVRGPACVSHGRTSLASRENINQMLST
jgi:hypothetical protein